jgi:threonine/homoserine/homoserine lactone efflux protein
MHAHVFTIAFGSLMGLAYIAAPGPVNVETVRQGLSRGWQTALPIQLGACAGHAFWAALAFAGLGVLALYPGVHLFLGLTGTVVLLYLGWSSLQEGVRMLKVRSGGTSTRVALKASVGGASPVNIRALGTGVAISVTNPFAVAFWLSVGGTVLHQSGRNPALFLVGFFLSVVVWALALPWATVVARQALHGRAQGWISSACGLALMVLGCSLGHVLLGA